MNNIIPKEPGLKRRLAYSKIIRDRNRALLNKNQFLVERTNYIEENIRQINNLYDDFIGYYNYEDYSNLDNVVVGASIKLLLSNSKLHITDVKNPVFCVICQYHSYDGIIRELHCKHKFHVDCIDKWFMGSKKCPACMQELVE